MNREKSTTNLKVAQDAKTGDSRTDDKIARIVRMLAEEAYDEFAIRCAGFASSSESPIERLMATALYYAVNSHEMGMKRGWFPPNNHCWYGIRDKISFCNPNQLPLKPGILIFMQSAVGKYKADFLIRFADYNGGYVWGAIECDGHDHHDLTRLQAQHDRERDRYFQSSGFAVLRYPGSEIWADPVKCATDALRVLGLLAAGDTARRWKNWAEEA